MKDKYIIILSNHRKFIPWKFDEDKIEKQLSLDWYAMTKNHRADYPNLIYRQISDLNDDYFNLGDLTVE